MNAEGMEDRYYFSDWGGCTCNGDSIDPSCPYWDEDEERCTVDDDFEDEGEN